MTRNELVVHLTNCGCYPDDSFVSEVGQLWINAESGDICIVPNEEYLTVTTWAHIVYELRIDPPLDRDSDYYVYQSWRESAYKEQQEFFNKSGGGAH
jgi:hypothetical protein